MIPFIFIFFGVFFFGAQGMKRKKKQKKRMNENGVRKLSRTILSQCAVDYVQMAKQRGQGINDRGIAVAVAVPYQTVAADVCCRRLRLRIGIDSELTVTEQRCKEEARDE